MVIIKYYSFHHRTYRVLNKNNKIAYNVSVSLIRGLHPIFRWPGNRAIVPYVFPCTAHLHNTKAISFFLVPVLFICILVQE